MFLFATSVSSFSRVQIAFFNERLPPDVPRIRDVFFLSFGLDFIEIVTTKFSFLLQLLPASSSARKYNVCVHVCVHVFVSVVIKLKIS